MTGAELMQVDNRFLDDLARVAGGALGAISGVRHEVEARLKHQFERILSEMDLVQRDEFEAVKAMAAKARLEQEALEKRVAELEAALGDKAPPRPASAKRVSPRRTSKGRAKPREDAAPASRSG